MTNFLVKILGFSESDLIIGGFFAVCLAVMVGIVIDSLSERLSFGVIGNAAVLLGTMFGGLVIYGQFVRPLYHLPLLTVIVIATASAVSGFLTLSYLKSSAISY